eukprot:TRINITY_DN6056_c0_g3_i1.p1 TRINITY_DN6056_c0_g3~~TRINITY_DN6056_c0_g3_i1.p1  ORF type:complete len:1173 (+),score=242.00 TRINITY_DN6056_c0_g3_i1:66-3584(+)
MDLDLYAVIAFVESGDVFSLTTEHLEQWCRQLEIFIAIYPSHPLIGEIMRCQEAMRAEINERRPVDDLFAEMDFLDPTLGDLDAEYTGITHENLTYNSINNNSTPPSTYSDDSIPPLHIPAHREYEHFLPDIHQHHASLSNRSPSPSSTSSSTRQFRSPSPRSAIEFPSLKPHRDAIIIPYSEIATVGTGFYGKKKRPKKPPAPVKASPSQPSLPPRKPAVPLAPRPASATEKLRKKASSPDEITTIQSNTNKAPVTEKPHGTSQQAPTSPHISKVKPDFDPAITNNDDSQVVETQKAVLPHSQPNPTPLSIQTHSPALLSLESDGNKPSSDPVSTQAIHDTFPSLRNADSTPLEPVPTQENILLSLSSERISLPTSTDPPVTNSTSPVNPDTSNLIGDLQATLDTNTNGNTPRAHEVTDQPPSSEEDFIQDPSLDPVDTTQHTSISRSQGSQNPTDPSDQYFDETKTPSNASSHHTESQSSDFVPSQPNSDSTHPDPNNSLTFQSTALPDDYSVQHSETEPSNQTGDTCMSMTHNLSATSPDEDEIQLHHPSVVLVNRKISDDTMTSLLPDSLERESALVTKFTLTKLARQSPTIDQMVANQAKNRGEVMQRLATLYPSIPVKQLEKYLRETNFNLDEAAELVYKYMLKRQTLEPGKNAPSELEQTGSYVYPYHNLYPTVGSFFTSWQEKFSAPSELARGVLFLKSFRDQLAEFNNIADSSPTLSAPGTRYYKVAQGRPEVYRIIHNACLKLGCWKELPWNLPIGVGNPESHSATIGWSLLWTWSKPKIDYTKLMVWQRVNHFPGAKNITRKDLLKKNISRHRQTPGRLSDFFDICPVTYILPADYVAFLDDYSERRDAGKNNIWISKPVSLSRGRGIFVFDDVADIRTPESIIVQKYIENPLLMDGFKFDLRLYILVTSMNPLEVFLYREGFARLSMRQYTANSNDLSDKFIHLTNASIQKYADDQHQFSENPGDQGGSKCSLAYLRRRLEQSGIDFDEIWQNICELVLKSLIAVQDLIPSQVNSFEVFGYDVLIDTNLRPWLIEINASPSMSVDSELDMQIKDKMIEDTIRLVDPPFMDRVALHALLSKRLDSHERGWAKGSGIQTTAQYDQAIQDILQGYVPRPPGNMPSYIGNYERISPSKVSERLMKTLRSLRNEKVAEYRPRDII